MKTVKFIFALLPVLIASVFVAPEAHADPVLTIATATNGTLNGNYTTTKLFVDEIAGDTIPLTITFNLGQEATEVEVVTNLNQREFADDDRNANGVEDGMEYNQTLSLIGSGADYYYRSYAMSGPNASSYTVTLNATKTGAYRLTARWKVSGDPNWRWFTNHGANRRDHAITVSPVTARDINLYEINTLTVEAKATGSFIERSTFEDLYDAPGAPRTADGRGFNLAYLTGLGVNWLWFQPVHPAAIEGREEESPGTPYNPGSPYAVKNFFEVNPWMSANYNGVDNISGAAARLAGMASFQGFVSAADTQGIGIMLDAPVNHTGFDVELAQPGVDLLQRDGETWLPGDLIKNREARFFSRDDSPTIPDNGLDEDYAQRATSAGNIAAAPDRGDFGKWNDVKDIYLGRYDALVNRNPEDNANHLNEGDRFYFDDANWTSDDDPSPSRTVNVTKQVWKYFARYTTYWLEKTRPSGQNRNSTAGDGNATARYAWDARGIDGLRCDFGQGVPPQCWEYIINVARSTKWNFVMMAESLDGGAVTYRSNRHFDILNENIVFPLKSAGNTTQFKQIFEDRRSAYGQGLVLANTTSHDEENYTNNYHPLLRYYLTNTLDGVQLIFMGQELGVTRTSGFTFYETNFGKQVAHFKKFNSMQPAWLNRAASPFGEKFLFDSFASVGQARRFSRALRSSNRYFLNRQAGGTREEIWAVAKYESANTSPNFQDVVFAFVNLRTEVAGQSDTFNVNVTQGPGNLFGIKSGRTYNVKNIAAYLGPQGQGFPQNRRDVWLWGPNGRSGTDVLSTGVFVALNGVPASEPPWKGESFTDNGYGGGFTGAGNSSFDWNDTDADGQHDAGESSEPFVDANGNNRYDPPTPFEAQYLKLYDVTPPPTTGVPTAPKAYAIGNQVTFSWTPASDPEGGISGYQITITGAGAPQVFTLGNVVNYTYTGAFGQTVQATIRSINNAGIVSASSAASSSVRLLTATGDEDQDGMSNGSEETAGTDPLDRISVFRITAVSPQTTTSLRLEWSSVAGIRYEVRATTDLAVAFENISGPTPITATGITTSWVDSAATGSRKFYQVRVVP